MIRLPALAALIALAANAAFLLLVTGSMALSNLRL